MPWSRHPDDGLDNLVAAHSQCNSHKRDHLASAEHVEEWIERTRSRDTDLEAITTETRWQRDPARTGGVARAIYLRLPSRARLWRLAHDFVPVDSLRLRKAFRM